MKCVILFFTIYFTFCVESGHLPVEKCNLEDGDCMKKQFQNAVPTFMGGIPALGIPVLDVMDMDFLKFDLSGFQFSLTDGKLKGLKNSIIDGVNDCRNVVSNYGTIVARWDLKKNTFRVMFHLDCVVKGKYTAGGQILILPITGDGDIKLKMQNVNLIFDIDYILEKKDGKEYLNPKKLQFEFDVKDNAHFQLTNLFNGNKELGDAMLKFLNENWKQISIEFGRPMIESAAKIIFKCIKMYFKNNPLNEIADY